MASPTIATEVRAQVLFKQGGRVRPPPATFRPVSAEPSSEPQVLTLATDITRTHASMTRAIGVAERQARKQLATISRAISGGKVPPAHTVPHLRNALGRAKRSLLLLMAAERNTVREFSVASGLQLADLPRIYTDPTAARRSRSPSRSPTPTVGSERGKSNNNSPQPRSTQPSRRRQSSQSNHNSQSNLNSQSGATSTPVTTRHSDKGRVQHQTPSGGRGMSSPTHSTVTTGQVSSSSPAASHALPTANGGNLHSSDASWQQRMLRRTRRHLKRRVNECVVAVLCFCWLCGM